MENIVNRNNRECWSKERGEDDFKGGRDLYPCQLCIDGGDRFRLSQQRERKKYLVNSREWGRSGGLIEGILGPIDRSIIARSKSWSRRHVLSAPRGCWKAIRPIIGPLGGARASIGLMDSQEGRSIPPYLVYKSHLPSPNPRPFFSLSSSSVSSRVTFLFDKWSAEILFPLETKGDETDRFYLRYFVHLIINESVYQKQQWYYMIFEILSHFRFKKLKNFSI